MAKSIKKSSAVTVTPSNELFKMDSKGDSSVRNTLLGQLATSNPASGRLRKGTSFNKVLKSTSILAMRSAEPAMTGRKIPDALTVVKKDKEKAGKVDRATKERLKRITGREGSGSGLWGVKSGGPREELMTEAMKSAGEYDAWEVIVDPIIEGEDLALKAIIKANTERVIPKVSLFTINL
jgi:nucleolar protein 53